MNNKDKPAYPTKNHKMEHDRSTHGHWGLSKRERFAMAAMQGLCASESDEHWWEHDNLAKESVMRADALLAELEKPQDHE